MTNIEILAFVNTYFEDHLDKAYWTGLDVDTKAASVIMVTDDIYEELFQFFTKICTNSLKLPPFCQALIRHKTVTSSLFIPIHLDIQLFSLRNASPASIISQINFV